MYAQLRTDVQTEGLERLCVELEGKAHEQHTTATEKTVGESVLESVSRW